MKSDKRYYKTVDRPEPGKMELVEVLKTPNTWIELPVGQPPAARKESIAKWQEDYRNRKILD
jgi:hypothetical protein